MSSNLFLPAQSDYEASAFGHGQSRINVGGAVRPPWYSAVSLAVAIYKQLCTHSDLPEAALISVAGQVEPAYRLRNFKAENLKHNLSHIIVSSYRRRVAELCMCEVYTRVIFIFQATCLNSM